MVPPGHLLMLGGSACPEFFHAIERRGLRAVVLTVPEMMEGTEPPACCALFETVDLREPLKLLRRILQLSSRYRLVGVLGATEYGLEVAAMVATQLGLPTSPPRTVQNTRDKQRMRKVLAAAGLDQVRYATCRSAAEAEAFLRQVGGPIIVKPSAGTGSEGVTRVEDARHLAAALALAAGSRSRGPVLCEEYVEGTEVSLEACTVDGRFVPVAMTDKLTVEGFLEIGHQQPSVQPAAVQEQVGRCAERALAALGFDQTVSHTEFRLSPAGPVLIETHTRMPGDSVHLLTRHTTGVDLADLMVGLSLGERAVPEPRPTGRGAAVRFLVGGPGRVETVHAPSLGEIPGVERAHLRVRPGDQVGACRSSVDRLGYAVASGPTVAAAVDAAESYLQRVEITWTAARSEEAIGSWRHQSTS